LFSGDTSPRSTGKNRLIRRPRMPRVRIPGRQAGAVSPSFGSARNVERGFHFLKTIKSPGRGAWLLKPDTPPGDTTGSRWASAGSKGRDAVQFAPLSFGIGASGKGENL